jgi:fatty acid desaturase
MAQSEPRPSWSTGAKARYLLLSALAWIALLIPIAVTIAYAFDTGKWAGWIVVSLWCLTFAWCAATGNLVQRLPWRQADV